LWPKLFNPQGRLLSHKRNFCDINATKRASNATFEACVRVTFDPELFELEVNLPAYHNNVDYFSPTVDD
jgi:hypothetical protein